MTTPTQNSAGKRFFGLHFYPGLAQYQEQGKDPYRVYLNEDTIRAMDSSFEGKPVYVHHVDGVPLGIDDMRKEMDGLVVRSFYNEADGKHWVEFMVASERGLRAIKQGMRLSNCYVKRGSGRGGMWNGISYQEEITAAEYEHLALVPNPRYEESVVMTPEEFKKYNDDKRQELKRVANKGDSPMASRILNLFKRAPIENQVAVDLAVTYVQLKSGREVTIEKLVNEADDREEKDKAQIADGAHYVKVGNDTMTVNDLVDKHTKMCDAFEEIKKAQEEGGKGEGEGDSKKKNAADDNKPTKTPEEEAAERAAAERLKNAPQNAQQNQPTARVETTMDRQARGVSRYGSAK